MMVQAFVPQFSLRDALFVAGGATALRVRLRLLN